MGVKNLWSLLEPARVDVVLEDLKHQTLAVDLSSWVCEALAVKQMQNSVKKPHLRNLFFRTSRCMEVDIKLIFVVDGLYAPALKSDTMCRRQNRRLHKSASCKTRYRHTALLNECCTMLEAMGIPYVHSDGEAEALCALMNLNGIVDGCITEDGDALLYGAKVIYRNFSTDSRKDFRISRYSAVYIEQQLNLSRPDLIAIALLTGCDYCEGINGIGIETCRKLRTKLNSSNSEQNLLDRFKEWFRDIDYGCFSEVEEKVRKRILDSLAAKDFLSITNEVCSEFMQLDKTIPSRAYQSHFPSISKFQAFMASQVEWEHSYALDKIFPFACLWCLKNLPHNEPLKPLAIRKSRIVKGIRSFDVEYEIKDENIELIGRTKVVTVPGDLFKHAFPDMVEKFEEEKQLKATKKKTEKSRLNRRLSRSLPELNLSLNKDDIPNQKEHYKPRPTNIMMPDCDFSVNLHVAVATEKDDFTELIETNTDLSQSFDTSLDLIEPNDEAGLSSLIYGFDRLTVGCETELKPPGNFDILTDFSMKMKTKSPCDITSEIPVKSSPENFRAVSSYSATALPFVPTKNTCIDTGTCTFSDDSQTDDDIEILPLRERLRLKGVL